MRMIHVVPVPGKIILNPDNGFKSLPPLGEHVPYSAYWQQRCDEGGVKFADPAAPVAAPAPSRPHRQTLATPASKD